MSIYRFWKISKFCSKFIGASIRFYTKSQIWGQTPYFFVVTPYCRSVINNGLVYKFLQVLKKIKFHSKSTGVSLWFYRKSLVYGKNWPKLRISYSWPPYYVSVIHNGPVYEFLWVFKKINFRSKSIYVRLWFYRKSPVSSGNWLKLYISWSRHPNSRSIMHNDPAY
jgi:hypothetical protein